MEPKRGLRTPLPRYIVDRLKANKQACILTAVDRSANVGEPLLLINEKLKPIQSWAVVEMLEGVEYKDAKVAVAELKDAVDEVSAREYLARNPKPTWAYKLKLVEAFVEPRVVDAAGRRVPNIKADDDIAFVATIQDSLLKDISEKEHAQLATRLADIWDERFGDGQDEPEGLAREEVIGAALLLIQHGQVDPDRYLYQIASKISKAEETYQAPKAAGKAAALGLEWRKEFGRGGTQVGVRRATQLKNNEPLSAETVLRMWSFFRRHEVDRQAEGFNEGEKGFPSAGKIANLLWGGDPAYDWLKKLRQTNRWPARKDLAPVHHGSEGEHEPLELDEVVEHIKPIIIRENAVMLTGGLPQWETTRGDIDVLIKNPLDEGTRKAIEFRVGRAFPPEISQRIEFLDDDLGGSFTTHVPLYDLALVPKTHEIALRDGSEFVRVEMADAQTDKADPYLLYPANPNKPVRSVFQTEYQGKSVHIDWRIAVRASQLIGWTLFVAKKGAIGQEVTSFEQAQRFNAGLTIEGNRVIKPLQITGGQGLQTVQKRPPPPPEWLDIDQRAWDEELKDGKRRHVMIAVDRPMVQFGRNEPYFKEYFLTRGQKFNGTAFIRATVGRGGTEEEEESGRVTPEGQIFWRFMISDKPLPSILRRRSVRLKRMPPDGVSAIPRDLMALVPAEYRYWEKRGEAARNARDALVDSRFFTESNVVVVGGRYKRVEERKKFYSLSQPAIKEDAVSGKFKLVWQTWRGTGTQRDAPSRQVWHLMIRAGGKKYAWTFQSNPLVATNASGISGAHTDADWNREGEIEPGSAGFIGNDTKATPSYTTLSDSGDVSLKTDGGFEIALETSVGKRHLKIGPEEQGSKIWVSELKKTVDVAELDDDGLVIYSANGPVAIECGCGGRRWSRRRRRAKCLSCDGTIEIGNSSYVWELKSNEIDLGHVQVKAFAAEGGSKKTGEKDKPDAKKDGNEVIPLITVPIGKGDEFQGYFKAVVLKPNDGVDGPLEPDTQNDIYSAADIEYAMRWNAENRKTDNIQHGEQSATGPWGFIIVQNYLADVDFWLGPNGEAKAEPNDWRLGIITPPDEGYEFIPAGSWIREGKATGKKLRDGLQTGEFNSWSIEGYATRTPTIVELPSRQAAA